ncbi:MAG TPA: hypothetical protein VMW72_04235 [Sedimentisphaerales bacterium]|nr:hypothetical protein [Sedimentisphaerales bacterium]
MFTNGCSQIAITDITERKRLEETATETTKQGEELKEQIEQLQHNIHEREQPEGHIKQQADELRAANEQLKHQIVESEQTRKELMEQLEALKNTTEEIQYETTKCSQGQEILGASTDNAEDSGKPITLSNDEKLKAVAELAKRLR